MGAESPAAGTSVAPLQVRVAELEAELAELQRAAAALRCSEERYRAVVQDQTELITRYTSPDFILTFVNDAACRAMQRTAEELRGRSFLPLVTEEDRERVAASIAALDADSPVCSFEHGVRVGDETRWYHWTNRALFDEQGRLVEYQGVGRDLTDRKRAEEALAKQNQELNRANRDLARLHREKDVLIAMVSHELRTPLVTGLGYLDMLLSGALGSLSEKAIAKMTVARKNLGRLAALIEDLLDYQRLVLGSGRPPSTEAIDVTDLLQEARADLLERSAMVPERVSLQLAPGLPSVRGDRDMLRRVLANLLDNAHHHGGPTCSVGVSAKMGEDGNVLITVSDDGPGIPPALQERVFDLFVKGEEASEGRGLGLAIVRAILNAHRSELSLCSASGEGTCVRFSLQPFSADPR